MADLQGDLLAEDGTVELDDGSTSSSDTSDAGDNSPGPSASRMSHLDPDYCLPQGTLTETQYHLQHPELRTDRYGFVTQRPPQAGGMQAGTSTSYSTGQPSQLHSRRVRKWRRMLGPQGARLEQYAALKPAKFKRRVRKGIPDEFRGLVWLKMSGGSALQARMPELYGLLRAQCDVDIDASIMRDLNRTFPQHVFFMPRQGPGQHALYNVLRAYAAYDTQVGYVQGMGFLASVLLLHMAEEDAFWTLAALMRGPRQAAERGARLFTELSAAAAAGPLSTGSRAVVGTTAAQQPGGEEGGWQQAGGGGVPQPSSSDEPGRSSSPRVGHAQGVAEAQQGGTQVPQADEGGPPPVAMAPAAAATPATPAGATTQPRTASSGASATSTPRATSAAPASTLPLPLPLASPGLGIGMARPHLPLAAMYTPGMPLLHRCLYQLTGLMGDELPGLAALFAREGVDVAMFSTHWFNTVFAYCLPFSHLLRLWDIFMLEGQKVVFRVALAVMHAAERPLAAGGRGHGGRHGGGGGGRHGGTGGVGLEEALEALSARGVPALLPHPDALIKAALRIKVSRRLASLQRQWEQKFPLLQEQLLAS